MKPSSQALLLAALTAACLTPFAAKAVHIDDPLFLWTAERIAAHPFDPYGFEANWSLASQPMFEIAKNPPLMSYLLRAAAAGVGWSEIALHLAFVLSAIAVVLGTHRLARSLCKLPLLAGVAAIGSPVFLVSSSNLMCDTTLLAFWIWSVVLWREGLERNQPLRLGAAAVLVAAAALTKYFGIALIPLLAAYALARTRRLGAWALCLLVPVLALAGYQEWTRALYGRGLLLDAASFATDWKSRHTVPLPRRLLTALSFTGGGVLPATALAFRCWSRRALAIGAAVSMAGGVLGGVYLVQPRLTDLRWSIGLHAGLFIAGGVGVLALSAADLWRERSPDSLLLCLWVAGTFVFAGFVNWTVNGRSILPMLPAVAILLARRIDLASARRSVRLEGSVLAPLALCLILSLWVVWGDTRMANAQKRAVEQIRVETSDRTGDLIFQGHWGFQFYMERIGARAVDASSPRLRPGDVMVLPRNNTRVVGLPQSMVVSSSKLEIPGPIGVVTMDRSGGAGFYSAGYGPVPFRFGRGLPESYRVDRLGLTDSPTPPRDAR